MKVMTIFMVITLILLAGQTLQGDAIDPATWDTSLFNIFTEYTKTLGHQSRPIKYPGVLISYITVITPGIIHKKYIGLLLNNSFHKQDFKQYTALEKRFFVCSELATGVLWNYFLYKICYKVASFLKSRHNQESKDEESHEQDTNLNPINDSSNNNNNSIS